VNETLLITAFVMGLVGGPHCVAMCSAACAGVCRMSTQPQAPVPASRMGLFQTGRLMGYSLLGAAVAGSVEFMAWMAGQSQVVRPLWSMFHVAAMLLGMWLLYKGEQPRVIDGWGQQLWRRLGPTFQRWGVASPLVVGMLWTFLPCGLLYSALLVASMSATAWQGGLIMAVFAIGSGVGMTAGAWALLRQGKRTGDGKWAVRLAGAVLLGVSAWALWMGITHPTGLFCLPPA